MRRTLTALTATLLALAACTEAPTSARQSADSPISASVEGARHSATPTSAVRWNRKAIGFFRARGGGAGRITGYLSIAQYRAVLEARHTRSRDARPSLAGAAAGARVVVLKQFYPLDAAAIDAELLAQRSGPAGDNDDDCLAAFDAGVAIGRDIGAAVISWAATDNTGIATDLIDRHHRSELEAAAILAYRNAAAVDAIIGCFDTKFAYWFIRPTQADPSITPAIGLPNHPSYPSAHPCETGAFQGILTVAFPREARTLNATAQQASISRVIGGLHYRFDGKAALRLVAGRRCAGPGSPRYRVARGRGQFSTTPAPGDDSLHVVTGHGAIAYRVAAANLVQIPEPAARRMARAAIHWYWRHQCDG